MDASPNALARLARAAAAPMSELDEPLPDHNKSLELGVAQVKPGGRLVYAVCSLEREEGEEQAAKVRLAPDPVTADELPQGLAPTSEGRLRTDPGMLAEAGGLDGFFIARWRKAAA